jgi:membrane protease YdiL (CAAX protease family)
VTASPLTRVPESAAPLRDRGRWWRRLAGLEVALAVAAVLLDLLLPALVILVLAGLSMLLRREKPVALGVRRPGRRLVLPMLAFAAAWSVFQLAVTMPVANHVSGTKQDLGVFADFEGNVGLLAALLLLSWTLGAVCEELAFRGYLLTRLRELLGSGPAALGTAVVASAVLFGVLHSEQGVVGVVAVAIDGIAFAVLRLRYDTVWAPVLAHGFNNTLGLLTFFLVGPVYGLW